MRRHTKTAVESHNPIVPVASAAVAAEAAISLSTAASKTID